MLKQLNLVPFGSGPFSPHPRPLTILNDGSMGCHSAKYDGRPLHVLNARTQNFQTVSNAADTWLSRFGIAPPSFGSQPNYRWRPVNVAARNSFLIAAAWIVFGCESLRRRRI